VAKLNWSGYYDVVILPPPAVRDYAIQLSHQLRGPWVLGKRKFLPHISLYHIPVRDEDFKDFARTVKEIGRTAEWGKLETTGFDMPLLSVSKPDWLDRLHRRVVRGTLQYFDKAYGAEKTFSLHRYSGLRLEFARKYLKKFGTPLYGMNFRPHITLSSAERDVVLPFRKIRFRPDRLHICELGESHSCQRIIG
jgi:hypothetical protein